MGCQWAKFGAVVGRICGGTGAGIGSGLCRMLVTVVLWKCLVCAGDLESFRYRGDEAGAVHQGENSPQRPRGCAGFVLGGIIGASFFAPKGPSPLLSLPDPGL